VPSADRVAATLPRQLPPEALEHANNSGVYLAEDRLAGATVVAW
jgi:hypothetical protein